MKKIEECPYCGYNQVREVGNTYKCDDCGMMFTEKDAEYEDIRHKISAYLTDCEATEEHPLDCTKGVMLTIGSKEAQGLSELEKPRVTRLYHDSECVVWLGIDGCENNIEYDDIELEDAQEILAWLNENALN